MEAEDTKSMFLCPIVFNQKVGGFIGLDSVQENRQFSEDIDFISMQGNSGIGVISDRDTQPLIMRLKFGEYAICGSGYIELYHLRILF